MSTRTSDRSRVQQADTANPLKMRTHARHPQGPRAYRLLTLTTGLDTENAWQGRALEVKVKEPQDMDVPEATVEPKGSRATSNEACTHLRKSPLD